MSDRIETERLVPRLPVPEDWQAARAFDSAPWSELAGGGDQPVFDTFRDFTGTFGDCWGMWMLTEPGRGTAIEMAGVCFPVGCTEREVGCAVWEDSREGASLTHEAALATRADACGRLGRTTAVSYVDIGNAPSRCLAEPRGARVDPHAAHPGSVPLLIHRHPSPEVIA